jgi:hypothetical protein
VLESLGFYFVLRQVPGDEVVGEWLRPGWYLPDVEDAGNQRVSSPQVCRCAGFVWLAGCGGGLETAAPESFIEPAMLGWPTTSFCSEAAALEFGNGV